MNVFKKGEIPDAGWAQSSSGRDAGWASYQKKVHTQAIKIDGAFEVETSEGNLTCKDGYLCIDARGYPYPVATDEFKLIYDPVHR